MIQECDSALASLDDVALNQEKRRLAFVCLGAISIASSGLVAMLMKKN